MNNKSIITISRYWNNPKITTTISQEGIAIQQDLNDFIAAIKQEVGSVAFVFTKNEFDKKFDNAVEKILSRVKEETIKVM